MSYNLSDYDAVRDPAEWTRVEPWHTEGLTRSLSPLEKIELKVRGELPRRLVVFDEVWDWPEELLEPGAWRRLVEARGQS